MASSDSMAVLQRCRGRMAHLVKVELPPRLADIGDCHHALPLVAVHQLVERGFRLVGRQGPGGSAGESEDLGGAFIVLRAAPKHAMRVRRQRRDA